MTTHDFWSAGMSDPAPLTAETLRKAFEAARTAPMRVCGATEPHVVHPADKERGGWTRCANCFQPVEVPA